MDLSGSAPVPGSEQDTTPSALVLDILERVHQVGNAAQAEEAAKTKGPSTTNMLVANIQREGKRARISKRTG